ncbi:Tyrosine--tRNA ligase, cytoplasmic [Cucumispora dikerogammari]|nr:Tyrosine--tRNA ligase, cytoplasmic [Cucumispora dikerogammari]
MSFTLYCSEKYNDLSFPIEYMNLPIRIEYTKGDEDVFKLENDNESFNGIKSVLNQIILICKKVDPHDLRLINNDVVNEIVAIKDTSIIKIMKQVLKGNPVSESSGQIGLNINYCYNNTHPTLTDIYIFTKIFKILRNGGRIEADHKKWFDTFQDEITKNLRIEPINSIDFHYFKIVVGRIDSVYPVQDRDTLYVESVMADRRREICSGLRGYCSETDLCGKQFLFLINLKTKKMGANNISEGMILCAVDGDVFEPLEVPNKKELTGKNLTIENPGYQIIPNFEYPILDLGSKRFANAKASFAEFRIVDHVLYFKERKVLLNNEEIKTKRIKNGLIT